MNHKTLMLLIVVALALSTTPSSDAKAEQKNITVEDIVSYTEEIGAEYNICPEFIQAIIEKESQYNPSAVNDGCIGLMQINEKWHSDRMERLGITDLYNPYSNILVGTDYLSELWKEALQKGYGDDLCYVLMRYNMNVRTANMMYADGEISEYAISVAKRSAELEIEHGK